MAEKSTKKAAKPANAPEGAKPVATAAAKPAKTTKVDRFTFVKGVAEGEKLAPQARVIVNVLSEHKDTGLSREELVKALTGKLNTRQPEGRILTYYQKTLAERGYISIVTEEIVAEAAPAAEPAGAAQ